MAYQPVKLSRAGKCSRLSGSDRATMTSGRELDARDGAGADEQVSITTHVREPSLALRLDQQVLIMDDDEGLQVSGIDLCHLPVPLRHHATLVPGVRAGGEG